MASGAAEPFFPLASPGDTGARDAAASPQAMPLFGGREIAPDIGSLGPLFDCFAALLVVLVGA